MRVLNDQIHEEFRLPSEAICPYCNGKLNTATCVELSEIQDGDYGICVGCYEIIISVVSADGTHTLRKPEIKDILIAKLSGIYDTLIEYQEMLRTTNHGLIAKK